MMQETSNQQTTDHGRTTEAFNISLALLVELRRAKNKMYTNVLQHTILGSVFKFCACMRLVVSQKKSF